MEKYTYVDTKEKLIICCNELKNERILGVDLECENGLHHYGTFITLIQVSSRRKNYIIDVYRLKHINCFVDILEDRSIIKVFHDISFDFRILNDQFKCVPKNHFDTQLAAIFLGAEKTGLGNLLEEYFNLSKAKKFQKADWTKRPLSHGMLDYAIEDSCHLIELKEILEKKLKEKNLLKWFNQEIDYNENIDWVLERQTFNQLKGYKLLTDKQRAILKRLFDLRESVAMEVNRPVYFVINTRKLMEIVKKCPSLEKWKSMKGVHPVVRQKANKFFSEQEKGKKEEIKIEKKKIYRMTPEQKKTQERYLDLRNHLSKEYKIIPHLLLNKDQIKELALGNLNCIRPWQKELLKIND